MLIHHHLIVEVLHHWSPSLGESYFYRKHGNLLWLSYSPLCDFYKEKQTKPLFLQSIQSRVRKKVKKLTVCVGCRLLLFRSRLWEVHQSDDDRAEWHGHRKASMQAERICCGPCFAFYWLWVFGKFCCWTVPFLSIEYGHRRSGVRTREENAHSRTVPFLLSQCCVYCQDKSQPQKLKRKYQCQKGSSDKGKHRTETTKVLWPGR